jgi:hypothetical protein
MFFIIIEADFCLKAAIIRIRKASNHVATNHMRTHDSCFLTLQRVSSTKDLGNLGDDVHIKIWLHLCRRPFMGIIVDTAQETDLNPSSQIGRSTPECRSVRRLTRLLVLISDIHSYYKRWRMSSIAQTLILSCRHATLKRSNLN